jgi:hypothetical protein
MNPLVSLDGTIGWVILAAPLVALAITATGAFWAARQRPGELEIEFDSRENRAAGSSLPDGAERAREVVAGDERNRQHGESVAQDASCELRAAIAEAEQAGDRGRLANLYLTLGVREREAGDVTAAAVMLRKSIVLATEAGEAAVHARGRLELGDLSQEAGDLGTACEHWQMARALFDQAELDAQRAEAEARMRRNGCPTDWVLTDF